MFDPSLRVLWSDWSLCISTGMWVCNMVFLKGVWLMGITDSWHSRGLSLGYWESQVTQSMLMVLVLHVFMLCMLGWEFLFVICFLLPKWSS